MPIPKGSKLSPEHRRKISESLKNSDKFREAMRRRSYHSHPRHIAETAESLRVKAEIEKKLGVHCIFITTGVLKRLVRESPTHQVLCHRRQCSKLLRVGDIVVSRGNSNTHGNAKRRYYHTDCWESLFIVL